MIYLKPDEKTIMQTLRQFRALKTEQIYGLLPDKTKNTVHAMLKSLEKNGLLYNDNGYTKIVRDVEPDIKVITAFTVLNHFMPRIIPGYFFRVNLPYQIMFMLDNGREYDIMTYMPGDMALLRVAQHDDILNEGTLIIAVQGESVLEEMPQITIPNALVAVVKSNGIDFLEVDVNSHFNERIEEQ